MDEAFGIGFFQDDDYCRRVEQAGFTIACAEDVFIHQHLSASFEKLGADHKQSLFEQNRIIYEAKWGEWKPHVLSSVRQWDLTCGAGERLAWGGTFGPGMHEWNCWWQCPMLSRLFRCRAISPRHGAIGDGVGHDFRQCKQPDG
ncbi:MAG: glycosyltransferase family 2 protein [Luteimonas sp.]